MADNALQSLTAAGLTPDQIRQLNLYVALKGIKARRDQGFSDSEIFSQNPQDVYSSGLPGADTTYRAGGGTAALGPKATLAGITSSYRLGKGSLALDSEKQRWDEAGTLAEDARNPANIVKVLQLYANSKIPNPIDNPILKNITPSVGLPPDSGGDAYIAKLLADSSDPASQVKVPGAAKGGSFTLTDPTVGISVRTGKPDMTLSENGPEKISPKAGGGMTVTPKPGVARGLTAKRQSAMVGKVTGRFAGISSRRQPTKGAAGGGAFKLGSFFNGAGMENIRAGIEEYRRTHPGRLPGGPYPGPTGGPAEKLGPTGVTPAPTQPRNDWPLPGPTGGPVERLGPVEPHPAPATGLPGPTAIGDGHADPWSIPGRAVGTQTAPGLSGRRPTVGYRDPRAQGAYPEMPGGSDGAMLPHFDLGGDLRAAYAAFHPAGQTASQSAAIDRAYAPRPATTSSAPLGGLTPDAARAFANYDATRAAAGDTSPTAWGGPAPTNTPATSATPTDPNGPNGDYRYGSSEGTGAHKAGAVPLGNGSYIRDANGNLTAVANPDSSFSGKYSYVDANGKTVVQDLTPEMSGMLAGELMKSNVAYDIAHQSVSAGRDPSLPVGKGPGAYDPTAFFTNYERYGDMSNWPKSESATVRKVLVTGSNGQQIVEYLPPGQNVSSTAGPVTETGETYYRDANGQLVPTTPDPNGGYSTPASRWASGGAAGPAPAGSAANPTKPRGLGTSASGAPATPPTPAPTPGGNHPPTTTPAPQTALSAAAKLAAQGLGTETMIDPNFIQALAQGQVPGLSSLSARAFHSLNPTRQAVIKALYLAAGYSSEDFDRELAANTPAGG